MIELVIIGGLIFGAIAYNKSRQQKPLPPAFPVGGGSATAGAVFNKSSPDGSLPVAGGTTYSGTPTTDTGPKTGPGFSSMDGGDSFTPYAG